MAIDLDLIVERHVREFNKKRLGSVQELRVATLLRRKNPYLFVARQTATHETLAASLVAATLSSSEETQFGNTLEGIAIDVCAAAYGGYKSAATGIDLEFIRDEVRYLVSIKSGPSWGNSSQIATLERNFSDALKVIRQNNQRANVQAINGCCYGRCDKHTGLYRKVCGSAFWELISGEPDLYQELVESLIGAATNGFQEEVNQAIGQVEAELRQEWSDQEGHLDWLRILEHNSKTRDTQ